jgi:hypothetical protein
LLVLDADVPAPKPAYDLSDAEKRGNDTMTLVPVNVG